MVHVQGRFPATYQNLTPWNYLLYLQWINAGDDGMANA